MKLETLLSNQDGLKKLTSATGFKNGRVLQIRRMIKPLLSEIKEWDKIRDDYIKENGTPNEVGNPSIEFGTPEFKEFVEWQRDCFKQEISVGDIKPLSDEEIEALNPSIDEIEQLEALGLYKDPEEVTEKK